MRVRFLERGGFLGKLRAAGQKIAKTVGRVFGQGNSPNQNAIPKEFDDGLIAIREDGHLCRVGKFYALIRHDGSTTFSATIPAEQ